MVQNISIAEITHTPAVYPFIRELNPPHIPNQASRIEATAQLTAEVYWKDLQRVIDKVMLSVKKKYPSAAEYNLELIGDLFFAPFRLDLSTLESTDRPDQKELSARIQHNLAHNIFYSSLGKAENDYVERVYDSVATFENIINGRNVPNADKIKQFWNGVKSQVAVMRVLHDNGYRLTLPDYTQEPDENGMVQQVYEWDVRNGVDLIAERGGHVALIDAKGQKNLPKEQTGGGVIERSSVDFVVRSPDLLVNDAQFARLPESMRETIEAFEPVSVKRARIIVPTSTKYLAPLKQSSNVGGRGRIEMPQFARLVEPRHREEIMRGMLQMRVS